MTTTVDWRSRIVGLTDEDPAGLNPHPLNPKVHPPHQQAALRAVLGELGWITGVVVNDRTGRVIDGHDRIDQALGTGQARVPVLHVDLDEAEELLALATFDPLGRLARVEPAAIDALLAQVGTHPPADPELVRFLAGVETAAEQDAVTAADGPLYARWTLEFALDDADTVRPALERLKAALPRLDWREDTTV
jgi:hypothetical protein